MDNLIVDMSQEVSAGVELNESTGEKTYVISGNFSTPDKKNRNGRVYPMSIWESNVESYQEEIKNNTNNTLMELEHPARTEVNAWEAVAKIRKLEMREENGQRYVYGEAIILNNGDKKTNQLKALIDAGQSIGVSTRGVGKLGRNNIVESYRMITTDIVSNPSNYESNLNGFNESLMLEVASIGREPVDETDVIVEAFSAIGNREQNEAEILAENELKEKFFSYFPTLRKNGDD